MEVSRRTLTMTRLIVTLVYVKFTTVKERVNKEGKTNIFCIFLIR